MLIVDAANVVGSRPDGWWRDRAGATGRLITRIAVAVAAGSLAPPVVVVLEGRARSAAEPALPEGLTVVRAPAAGDDTIVDVAASAGTGAPAGAVVVVTADRALQQRVLAAGGRVWRPGRLLDLLPAEPDGYGRGRKGPSGR
ncbi:MAG TPA: hypothetical protein VFN68_09600 [Acidimicrobiales bacterium]|nr:hypothetical protein [Acidimicrobiales bacterium]